MFRLFIFLLAALLLPFSEIAAQEIPKDKEFKISTASGVNLYDLQYSFDSADIEIGPGEFPSKMQFVRKYNQYSYQPVFIKTTTNSAPFASHSSHNFALTALCAPCDMGSRITTGNQTITVGPPGEHIITVVAFDGSHSFTSIPAYWGSARTWSNRYNDGATLADDGDHVTLTTRSGDQVIYSHTDPTGSGIGCGAACAVAVYARFASGEMIIFSYDKIPTAPLAETSYFYPTLGNSAWSLSRLTSVVNSRGYGFQLQYLNPSLTTGDMQTRTLITQIAGFRASCVSPVVECATGVLPQVSYQYTVVAQDLTAGTKVYRLTTYTPPEGNAVNYEYNGPEFRLSKIYRSGYSATPVIENTYAAAYADVPSNYVGYVTYPYSGKVISQKDGSQRATSYAGGFNLYTPNASSTTTINYSDASVETLYFPGDRESKSILPTRVDLPLDRHVYFEYDAFRRLSKKIDAGGISETYTRDDRGNVTQVTYSPRAGSGNIATSEMWSFPICNGVNFRACNKPQFYVDRNGNRTDYQYDANHGGLTVKLAPADPANKRAVEAFYYSSFYPASGVVAPVGTSLTSVFQLTTQDSCSDSGVQGSAVDFSYVCPATARSRTSFLYTASSSSSRTSFELEGIVADVDGAAARTCYRYNINGRKISEAKPRAASSCS